MLCSNVLEHIKDDYSVIVNADRILKPGGQMIIIVPLSEKLYSTLDSTIGRFGLKMFNLLVPLFKLIDPVLPWKGLSLIIVARKLDS